MAISKEPRWLGRVCSLSKWGNHNVPNALTVCPVRLCLSVRISSSLLSIRLHRNTLSQLLTLYKSRALCAYIDAEYCSLDALCSTSTSSGTFSDSRPTGVARICFTTWGAAPTNALPVRRAGVFVFIAHLFGARGYVGSLNFWPFCS